MIKTVKIQGSGYLVNGELSVLIDDDNVVYQAVKEWLKTNTPESEFTAVELAEQAKQKAKEEALSYLDSTDFYFTVDKYATLAVIKKVELEIKRAEARVVLNG